MRLCGLMVPSFLSRTGRHPDSVRLLNMRPLLRRGIWRFGRLRIGHGLSCYPGVERHARLWPIIPSQSGGYCTPGNQSKHFSLSRCL